MTPIINKEDFEERLRQELQNEANVTPIDASDNRDLQGTFRSRCRTAERKEKKVQQSGTFCRKEGNILPFHGVPYGTFSQDKPL